jgi:alkyl sulfatase BDS1-like metallo-beta-lactamase superfamily hydrolase
MDLKLAAGLLEQTGPDELVQSIEVALNGEKAEGVELTINLTFSDLGETRVFRLENSVLHVRKQAPVEPANASLTLTRGFLVRVLTRQVELKDMLTSPELQVSGSTFDLLRFFSLLDRPDLTFPIVTPKL